MLAVGWFQYSAVLGYNEAAKKLDARTVDDQQDLLRLPDAETMLGKAPDGPGNDYEDGGRSFTVKKYTWWGPIKSYTLTAFYTKEAHPYLHHFETEGAKLAPEPIAGQPAPGTAQPPVAAKEGGPAEKAVRRRYRASRRIPRRRDRPLSPQSPRPPRFQTPPKRRTQPLR